MNDYIIINEKDNVVIALKNYKAGETLKISSGSITLLSDITRGHKIAIRKIEEGEDIIKYGFAIGHATKVIDQGEHIHTHNLKTNLGDILSYEYQPVKAPTIASKPQKTFNGYKRANGDVGIRNELWIVPTVGCVNGTADRIIEVFKSESNLEGSEIDAVVALKHPYGCSQMGDDHQLTVASLQNIVRHPNAGGVLVLGLGCENNQVKDFKESLKPFNDERIKFLTVQEVSDEIEAGVEILKTLHGEMKKDKREACPLSELKIGLECGGSDGLSGITANPLLGHFSDFIIDQGGTSVLTEVPEMFGAETILMSRCENEAVFEKTVNMINDFKKYYHDHGQVIYENPSPGNKKGGISTLEDKALGCTQKSGSSSVKDVLKMNETLKVKGLNLISAPGNDAVATTVLGMSGCHMVLFTTGRGTPFGGFIPTVKVSTNTPLAQLKKNWIDFDAGQLVGQKSMEALLEEFIDYIIEVASGAYVNQEKNNFREIAIFKDGVTL